MMNLGVQAGLIDKAPHIPMLKESPPRQGFFEPEEFEKLRDALPDYLKGVATFGYKLSWRVSEITGLTWGHIDMRAGTVTLNPGETKNDLRRTAVRSLVRAGNSERVAMQITGHKTRSVFDRYDIVSDSDLRAAAQKQAAYLDEIGGEVSTLTSTLAYFPTKDEKDEDTASHASR